MTPLLVEAFELAFKLSPTQQDEIAKLVLDKLRPVKRSAKIRDIYTDGAFSGNAKKGGWGVVVYFEDGSTHELGGFEPNSTSNRMELLAAIEALKYWRLTGRTTRLTIYSDSKYLVDGITKWVTSWKKRGWVTTNGSDVANRDLWQQLIDLNDLLVSWQWVKGHSGVEGNERSDAIATQYAQGKKPQLRQLVGV